MKNGVLAEKKIFGEEALWWDRRFQKLGDKGEVVF